MSTKNQPKRKYELKARAKRQAETRQRIVDATVALHEEVGPSRTTVSEIARRVGVQRLTVYNHFPTDADLLAACSGQYVSAHPFPDLEDVLAVDDPWKRLNEVLRRFYARYRETEPMTRNVLRDRELVPAVDAQAAKTIDASMANLVDALAGPPTELKGANRRQVRAAIRLALAFGTWDALKQEGLNDDDAAALMTSMVRCAAGANR